MYPSLFPYGSHLDSGSGSSYGYGYPSAFSNHTWIHISVYKKGNTLTDNVGGQKVTADLSGITLPTCLTPGLGFYGTNTDGSPALQYFGHINANVTGGSIVNFYDETDSAITTWWDVNNVGFKPQPLYGGYGGQYYYDFSQPAGDRVEYGYVLSGTFYDWRYVTHADEAKAYVDQSITGSVGSNTDHKGAITASGISEDAMGADHSYEWNNAFQDPTTFSFYNSLMASYHFTPISIPTSP